MDSAKVQKVEELHTIFANAKSAVLSDFRGISVLDMTELRRKFKSSSVNFRIVKNTLAKRAIKDTEFEGLDDFFTGPTSIAVSDDEIAPARALAEAAKTVPEIEIKAGCIGGKIYSIDEIKKVAELPTREVLLSQSLMVMKAPVSDFVGVMNAIMRDFINVLNGIKEKRANVKDKEE